MPSRRFTVLATALAAAILLAVAIVLLTPERTPVRGMSGDVADVGGDFTLTDHHGTRVTAADYEGQYLLVFFGFTNCPDMCPMTLMQISAALDLLGADAERIQPLFISVDPARDTVPAMARYVANFHPSLVGLTGSAEEIEAAARAWRVFYQADEPDADGAYEVTHSMVIFLMDPRGRFLANVAGEESPEELARAIREGLRG